MSSDGRLGKGAQLWIADEDGTTFDTRAIQLMEVPMPEREAPKVKITNQDSPGRTHEYIPGLTDVSELQFEYLWTPEAEATIDDLFAKKRNMRTVYPKADGTEPTSADDNPRHNFPGHISKIGGKVPVDEAIIGSFTVALDGEVTLTEET